MMTITTIWMTRPSRSKSPTTTRASRRRPKGDSTATNCSSPGSAIDASSNPFNVTEEAGWDLYCVKLAAEPAEVAAGETAKIVTVTITSDNPDITLDTDRTKDAFQNTLTFTGDVGATEGSWNTLVPVHVKVGRDDDVRPDDETATLSHAATGGGLQPRR